MNLLKSIYVSAYITLAVVACVVALRGLTEAGLASAWLGTLIAAGLPAGFFARLFLRPTARTSAQLPGLLGGSALGLALALLLGGGPAAVWALFAGPLGFAIYVVWYSRFGQREAGALAPGGTLPTVPFEDAEGRPLSSDALLGKPTVWIFYRGNWCPLCMAQIREVAAQYREIAARGAQVVLISPQPAANSRSLSQRFDAPMHFVVDRDNQAARRLGVLAEKGLPAGMQLLGYDSDVPLPTVFITDAQGRILYADLTSNYRIRPEPAEFLRVLDAGAA